MKFRKLGRIALAAAVSAVLGFGMTSCSVDYTVGYLYVTGAQYNQIAGFRMQNNTGQLYSTSRGVTGSGGQNPVKVLVLSGGRFVYVLNAGCGGTGTNACTNGAEPGTGSNISVFSVGGGGALTFQQSYYSQGRAPISIQASTSGAYLYVLDSLVPEPSTPPSGQPAANFCPGQAPGTTPTCGDITAFRIDGNTGRLSLITNQQVKDPYTGASITYFPIGTSPIEFKIVSNSYLMTIENGAGTLADPTQAVFFYQMNATNGQLALTQNAPLPTNACHLTYINTSATGSYVYLLDAGDPTNTNPNPACASAPPQGQILPYTVGANGTLQSLPTGAVPNYQGVANPVALITDAKGKFVYVANAGPNTNINGANSSISGWSIQAGGAGTAGELLPIAGAPFSNSTGGSGSSPRCILEDPSNQYIYTANYNDSTVTGMVLNNNAGVLTPLRKGTQFPTVGQPTWCAASGTTF